MERRGSLLGIGNGLLNIIGHVDDEFLRKYDLQTNSVILADERHIRLLDDITTNYEVYKRSYIKILFF